MALAELAARQYGVVARWQLIELGFSRDAIAHRLATGRLHVLYRGVYAVGHTRVCREGRWLAAVLACGDGAALSHRSAAALWGIRQYDGRIEITAPHARRRGRGLVARRSPMAADERVLHRAIPVTTPERTLLDLAAVLKQPHQLDKAVREAEHLRLADFNEVQRLLDRYPRKRGTTRLRKAIATAAESMARTRSELEDRFRARVLDAYLPTPLFNATIELDEITIEADAFWPDHKVIVELDGWDAHRTHAQFVADRARDRALQTAGYAVLRYTWADLELNALARLLSARRPRQSGHPRSAARRA